MGHKTFDYYIVGTRKLAKDYKLGTVVDNIEDLIRINAGEEPDKDTDISEFDENLEAALGQVKKVDVSITAQATGAPAGSEAKINWDRDDMDSYKGLVKTTQFEPDKAFYQSAVDRSPKMKTHFDNFSAPVYMITGRKVLTENSSYEFNRKENKGGVLGFFVNLFSAVSLGANAGGSKGIITSQKADGVTGEHLLAVRVTKLRYRRKVLGVAGAKVLTSKPMKAGDLADADGEETEEWEVEVLDS